MFMNKLEKILNSADGKRLKNQISASEKDRILREFSKLDPNEVRQKISGLSSADLMKIMKNL